MFIKASSASVVLQRFTALKVEIIMYGQSKNINYEDKVILENAEQIKNRFPLVIMPESNFKKLWNVIIIILLAYTATYVPFKVSFVDETSPGLFAWDLVVDGLFMIDIFVNFLAAYEDKEDIIEVRVSKIAKQYIKSWFFLDLVATIPFQLFEDQLTGGDRGNAQNAKLLRLARLPRLYRLLRILRLFKMIRLVKYNKTIKRYLDVM